MKYTSYTNQGGPVYTLSKDKIFSIVYENGQSEQYSSPEGWSLDSTNEGKLELRAGTEIPIIPACAICGSRAEIPAGYEIMASVAETVSFVRQGNTYSILRQ